MGEYDDLLEKGMREVPEDVGEHERFEMPEVESRKEGSNTVVENFDEIADRFNRDPKELSNFIQEELGTAGHLESGELVLNGEFRRGNIQGRLQNYADELLFCDECGSPDTELTKEKGVEMMKCEACGARNPV